MPSPVPPSTAAGRNSIVPVRGNPGPVAVAVAVAMPAAMEPTAGCGSGCGAWCSCVATWSGSNAIVLDRGKLSAAAAWAAAAPEAERALSVWAEPRRGTSAGTIVMDVWAGAAGAEGRRAGAASDALLPR